MDKNHRSSKAIWFTLFLIFQSGMALWLLWHTHLPRGLALYGIAAMALIGLVPLVRRKGLLYLVLCQALALALAQGNRLEALLLVGTTLWFIVKDLRGRGSRLAPPHTMGGGR